MSQNTDTKLDIGDINPDFWDAGDNEELTSITMDDAIQEYLDSSDIDLHDPTITIMVNGFNKRDIREYDMKVLDDLLDKIDEEYGNPDKPYQPNKRLLDAEKEFVKVFLEEYDVWACDKVCEREINVHEWVKENEPQWLKEK
jgi:hypothetical protein